MLAVALDAEELEEYNMATIMAIAFNRPKTLKTWKWGSPDHAGTKPVYTSIRPAEAMVNLAATLLKGDISPSGSGEEWARVTGRTVAYLTEAGELVDAEGNPADKTELTIILPINKKKVN